MAPRKTRTSYSSAVPPESKSKARKRGNGVTNGAQIQGSAQSEFSNKQNGRKTKSKQAKPTHDEERENAAPTNSQRAPPPVVPCDLGSSNIVHRLYRHTTGQIFKHKFKRVTLEPFVQQLSEFRVAHRASPFDRRVTAMEWHPTHPTLLAVGSKGGDLMLWDYEKGHNGWTVVQGIGKGGSVQALKHDLSDPSWIFTSSIDGMVSRQNIDSRIQRIYLVTNDWDYWYCSVDVNYLDNVLVAGDNVGKVVMMSREGQQLWSDKLHKQKVTHCEFNKRCPWLLATASTDKTVKVWDIRSISGKDSALYQLTHERPINSAYFSPDGTKLLTTDQHHELRIYAGPLWDRLERTIVHPHRFFQHLTPIKASWHPFQNLIVVGRYPDEALTEFKHDPVKSIDAYDVDTGELACRLVDQSATGIQSLNVFSPNGDALATGMGFNTLIWQNADILSRSREEHREALRRQGRELPADDGPPKVPLKRRRGGGGNNQKLTEKLQAMKKMKR